MERPGSDILRTVTIPTSRQSPANDNRFRIISDAIDREMISSRLETAIDELTALGAADDALIEALLSSFTTIAERSSMALTEDPSDLHAMGRYNQLSRLSGVLEWMKANAMRVWVERLGDT